MKKVLVLVLVGLPIAALVLIIVGAHSRKTVSVPGSSPSSPPAATQPTSTLPASGTSTSVSSSLSKLKPPVRKALTAAVLENSALTFAQLQNPKSLRATLVQTVVPNLLPDFQKVYTYTGKVLAKEWDYPSVNDALLNGDYYVLTNMYKVDQLTRSRAVVSLYCFTHFRTAQDRVNNQEHWDAGIDIIMLKKVKGQWLFVGTKDPTATEAPSPEPGLSFDQEKQRLQPYLGGFHVYSGSG